MIRESRYLAGEEGRFIVMDFGTMHLVLRLSEMMAFDIRTLSTRGFKQITCIYVPFDSSPQPE